jgi:hypothetical protein
LHEKDRSIVPSIEEIEQMGHLIKRKWVHRLDKLRKYGEQEGNLLDKGQAAITSHFKPSTQPVPRPVKIAQKRRNRATIPKTMALRNQRKSR